MNVNKRHEVFDYIIYLKWDPIGEELARNTIGYRRLLESGTLDKSKGTHILIVHGELVEYGDKSLEKEILRKNIQDVSMYLLLNVLLKYANSQLIMIIEEKRWLEETSTQAVGYGDDVKLHRFQEIGPYACVMRSIGTAGLGQ
ncbi:7329_t:CDS:2 [Ambispora gerdemannii]|uniref:7329_t:CDS:1 n=1 Tax=Ambispora gerdemannii TaxID=144530 RepID=A0A9N8YSQ5_9GLOM|nr:7329_t:CDS:2 [Ambispora gerdemannii]